MKYFISCSLLVLFSVGAFAQNTGTHYIFGNLSCGLVLENQDDEVGKLVIGKYVQGYLTGRNYERGIFDRKQVKNVDFDTIVFSVIRYCQDDPLKKLSDASGDIYLRLVGE